MLFRAPQPPTVDETTNRAEEIQPVQLQEVKRMPITKQCLLDNVVYEVKITTPDDEKTKRCIGMTANLFKERFRNHKKSFDHQIYARETERMYGN